MGKAANRQRQKRFDTQNETPANVRELGNRRKMVPQDIVSMKPANLKQSLFFEYVNNGIPIIGLDGSPGTGKTFLMLYAALTQVAQQKFERVVLIRSAVETRSMGFLPGDQSEKEAPYEAVGQELINNHIFKSFNDGYDHFKKFGQIEFHTTAHIRGKTFDNAIIVVDEVQNLDYEELRSVFTRLGQNSHIYFGGDTNQNDLSRKREKSGWERFKKVLRRMDPYDVAMISFTRDDMVRNGLIRDFLIAEEDVDRLD